MKPKTGSEEQIEWVVEQRHNPLGFVMGAFPWGKTGTLLEREAGPDDWQRDILVEIGKRLEAGGDEPIRIACAGGHGVGHTTLIAWINLWFMSTRIDPAITVTANTEGQLLGKTWLELRRWHGLAINRNWFKWTARDFYRPDARYTHAAHAVPWSADQPERFAGCMARDVLTAFDEASAIPPQIWDVIESYTMGPRAIWLAFGKPTRTHEEINGEMVETRFRQCWTSQAHRWTTFNVDSRNAKMVNRGQTATWSRDYGEESDFMKIRVRGQFPAIAPD